MNSIDYLNAMNKKLEWTDYRIAKNLAITPSSVAAFRNGNSISFSDLNAIRIAEFLTLLPQQVVADMHLAKAKTKTEKDFWRGMRSAAVQLKRQARK